MTTVTNVAELARLLQAAEKAAEDARAALDAALASVRPGGTVSVIGVHDLEPYPLPALMTLFRSVSLRMTTAPEHRTWSELVPLVANGK